MRVRSGEVLPEGVKRSRKKSNTLGEDETFAQTPKNMLNPFEREALVMESEFMSPKTVSWIPDPIPKIPGTHIAPKSTSNAQELRSTPRESESDPEVLIVEDDSEKILQSTSTKPPTPKRRTYLGLEIPNKQQIPLKSPHKSTPIFVEETEIDPETTPKDPNHAIWKVFKKLSSQTINCNNRRCFS